MVHKNMAGMFVMHCTSVRFFFVGERVNHKPAAGVCAESVQLSWVVDVSQFKDLTYFELACLRVHVTDSEVRVSIAVIINYNVACHICR